MKKQYLIGMMLLASIICFTSCSNNDDNEPEIKGKAATVDIRITGNLSSRGPETNKENATEDESRINSYEAYVFDVTTGSIIDYRKVEGDGLVSLNAETGTNRIVVIANAEPAIGEMDSYSKLMEEVGSFAFDYTNAVNKPAGTVIFEMSGEKKVVISEGNNAVTVIVKRLVSKFETPKFKEGDILNISQEKLDELFGAEVDASKVTFDYITHALANGLDKSYVLPRPSAGDWDATGLSYLNSEFDTDKQYQKNYSGFLAGEKAGESIYVYENYPKSEENINGTGVKGFDPLHVYCFIIKGNLTYDGVTKTRYWRVNLVKETGSGANHSTDSYSIARNGVYKVTIDAIKTIGYDTPKDAEEETQVIPEAGEAAVDVTVKVEEWDVYISNTPM